MIIDLEAVRAADIPRAGGKGANLGELIAAGLPVPGGFCVTADAYRAAVEPLQARMAELLSTGRHEQLRGLVADAPLPDGLAEHVRSAVAALSCPVAVRSSATAEDLPDASFAGQQQTILGVVGADAVLEAIRQCWASLWTDRAIAYRAEQGFADEEVSLAVVVQRMIAAEAAGVSFTADPITGRRDRIVIESSWGLGESVVSGAVTPDSFSLPLSTPLSLAGRRITRRAGDKRTRIDLTREGAAVTSAVPQSQRRRLSLRDEDVRALARLSRRVEQHYGRPMDIEWAVHRGRPWLLQARPITTAVGAPHAPKPGKISRFIRTDIIEHFPAPYPLDLSMVELAIRCLARTAATAGIRLRNASGLVSMDDDGVARIGRPEVSLLGVPIGLTRIARMRWRDPRTWSTGPGARARALVRRLASLPTTVDNAALADALSEAVAQGEAFQTVRFRDYLSFHLLRGQCLDLLLRLARTELTQFDLLGDLDYATTIIDRRLRELAARAPGGVRHLLSQEPIDVEAVRRASPEWWRDVEAFLAEYGARTTRMYQPFSSTAWREDPSAFLTTLAMMRSQPEPAPRRPHEEVVANVSARLPGVLRGPFQRLVADYRCGHVMREASVVEFEELGAVVRRLALEAGRRMVEARLIAEPGQVRYVTLDELLGWLRTGATAVDVERRIGARPRAQAAWSAGRQTGPASGDELTGVAASPGTATGPARVVAGPDDFKTLQRGDILVCQATDPAWTPLFTLAAGVVAETGGRLSHAAIVAREYGIPAVLGVPGATARIADGARLRVDGTAGRVADLS